MQSAPDSYRDGSLKQTIKMIISAAKNKTGEFQESNHAYNTPDNLHCRSFGSGI